MVLTRQDKGQIRAGVFMELAEGMQFGQHLNPQQRRFIHDQDHFHFFVFYQGLDFLFDKAGHDRLGVAGAMQAQLADDLPVKFHNRPGGGCNINDFVFRGVEVLGCITDGGGFAAADVAGDNGGAAQLNGVGNYWLELLKETEYLTAEQFESINKDAVEIIKLITSIIKSVKLTTNH